MTDQDFLQTLSEDKREFILSVRRAMTDFTGKSLKCYLLIGEEIVATDSIAFMVWHDNATEKDPTVDPCAVAKTEIDNVQVSTVFLPVRTRDGCHFETMVFRTGVSGGTELGCRTKSLAEARQAHEEVCNKVRESLAKPLL